VDVWQSAHFLQLGEVSRPGTYTEVLASGLRRYAKAIYSRKQLITVIFIISHGKKKTRPQRGRKGQKTYNTRDSPVVTDLSTNLALTDLSMGERTGSRALLWVWSYVKVGRNSEGYIETCIGFLRVVARPTSRSGYLGGSCKNGCPYWATANYFSQSPTNSQASRCRGDDYWSFSTSCLRVVCMNDGQTSSMDPPSAEPDEVDAFGDRQMCRKMRGGPALKTGRRLIRHGRKAATHAWP
jgi:hypothetical protein